MIILHPLKQRNGTVVLNKVPKVDVSENQQVATFHQQVVTLRMHQGKGNAEQAAKNNIVQKNISQ